MAMVLPLPLFTEDIWYPSLDMISRVTADVVSSDIHRGLKANLNFKLGKPFKPFEQLMGVLPDRSKKIVPEPYHVYNSPSPCQPYY